MTHRGPFQPQPFCDSVILPGFQAGAGFAPSFDSARDTPVTAQVRPPSDRKVPSTKQKTVRPHLGSSRKKRHHDVFFGFPPFQPSMASQQYQTQLPSKKLSCISSPRLKRFIHKLCPESHPNPCHQSSTKDTSLPAVPLSGSLTAGAEGWSATAQHRAATAETARAEQRSVHRPGKI